MKLTAKVHLTLVALVLAFASTSFAQEVVRKEAPPEIRALFQALTAAANGDAAAWESFAKVHYTDELLKKESPAQRAALHKSIQDRFGSIAIGGVRREMGGPLQVVVKGAKAEGTLLVDIDEGAAKVHAISVQ